MNRLKFILGILLFACAISVFSGKEKADAKVRIKINNNTGELVSAKGQGEFVIGKKIESISYPVDFDGCYATKVKLLNNTKFAVRNGVLYNKKMTKLIYYPACKKGESFKVPSTVKTIGDSAFYENKYLKNINLNKNLQNIERYAFAYSNIQKINIPANVETIERGCFFKCEKLSCVDNKANLYEMPYEMFMYCTSLENFDMGNEVGQVREDAFAYCGAYLNVSKANRYFTSLDGILYSKDMTTLIHYTGKKKGEYIIPDSVTKIEDYALRGSKNLTGITLGKNLTYFNLNQLDGCRSLRELNLSENLESVGEPYYGEYYFELSNLLELKQITVPESNKNFKIYDGALYSCDYKTLFLLPFGADNIDLHDDVEKICQGSRLCQNRFKSISISDNNKMFISYKGVLYYKNMEMIYLFPGGLTSYEVPVQVKNVSAISNDITTDSRDGYLQRYDNLASNLESITVEDGNKYFKSEDGVLYNRDMTKLCAYPLGRKGSYVVPKTVTSIETKVFAGASKLTQLTITKNVKCVYLGLVGCSSLKKLTFKEGVERVWLYGGTDYPQLRDSVSIEHVYFPSTMYHISVYYMNYNTIYHGYDNTGKFTGEEDTDISSTKSYVKDCGYIYKSRGAVPEKVKNFWVVENGKIYIRAYKIIKGIKVYGSAKWTYIE